MSSFQGDDGHDNFHGKQSNNFSSFGDPKKLKRNLTEVPFDDTNSKKSSLSVSDYLVTFTTRSQKYCVGFVDIVNSTKISARLNPSKLSQYYEVFLNSMSKIIGKFGGKAIKNIGDSLLYYFPNSVNGSKDGLRNCIYCGLTMANAQKTISEELTSKKLPTLNYRISSDFGTVILMNTSTS